LSYKLIIQFDLSIHLSVYPMNQPFFSASEPRKPRSLAMNLVDKLTIDVREGKLRPGEKLPTEAEIMQSFGVSRTVVREALSKLQASALVETRHGIGTFVLPQDIAPAFKVSPSQLGTLREVIALLEFRISIETEAAALAAIRRSEQNLLQMKQAMNEFGAAINEGRNAVQADFLFHQEIAHATQNKHFQELMQSLGTGAIPRGRLENAIPVEPERLAYLRRVHLEHESIFNAISAQDVDSARAAMRTHLSNSRERLKKGDTSDA
jgi:GntR family transcriptional repressor for pyruvate dehydrogenase complex